MRANRERGAGWWTTGFAKGTLLANGRFEMAEKCGECHLGRCIISPEDPVCCDGVSNGISWLSEIGGEQVLCLQMRE
jgi:hypothetical protein